MEQSWLISLWMRQPSLSNPSAPPDRGAYRESPSGVKLSTPLGCHRTALCHRLTGSILWSWSDLLPRSILSSLIARSLKLQWVILQGWLFEFGPFWPGKNSRYTLKKTYMLSWWSDRKPNLHARVLFSHTRLKPKAAPNEQARALHVQHCVGECEALWSTFLFYI